MECRISGLAELDDVAAKLVKLGGDGRIFLFYGEMGAGKTTLIKALCRCLGVDDMVSSPTFSIVNEYHANGRVMYHFDFYRLKDETEAMDLGYEDYFYSGNYCFIEWPEKIPGLIPDHFIKVHIIAESETERTITAIKE